MIGKTKFGQLPTGMRVAPEFGSGASQSFGRSDAFGGALGGAGQGERSSGGVFAGTPQPPPRRRDEPTKGAAGLTRSDEDELDIPTFLRRTVD